jgi:hypothetical protein
MLAEQFFHRTDTVERSCKIMTKIIYSCRAYHIWDLVCTHLIQVVIIYIGTSKIIPAKLQIFFSGQETGPNMYINYI